MDVEAKYALSRFAVALKTNLFTTGAVKNEEKLFCIADFFSVCLNSMKNAARL
jgi:hypothetical protein